MQVTHIKRTRKKRFGYALKDPWLLIILNNVKGTNQCSDGDILFKFNTKQKQ